MYLFLRLLTRRRGEEIAILGTLRIECLAVDMCTQLRKMPLSDMCC